jgi:hypothetical protein
MPPRWHPSENFTVAICRWVLVYLRWKYGVSEDITPRTTEEAVQWLCYKGISIYTDQL